MALIRYTCAITHARHVGRTHAFRYRSPMWLVDLDDMPRPRLLKFLGSFQSRDHFGDPRRSIRENLDAFLADRARPRPARVQMLTGARSMGHCFNPITVYWCRDAEGERQDLVVEVHNTYGGRHAYLLSPDDNGRDAVEKAFYVSPFLDTRGRYRFRITEPTERVDVSILLEQDERIPFTAALHGHGRPAGMLGAAGRPLAQLRVTALIRLHGIALWLRRIGVRPRTDRPTLQGNLRTPQINAPEVSR